MLSLLIGLGLMFVGAIGILLGRRQRNTVTASAGSVAIGGNNSGIVQNVNTGSLAPQPAHSGGHTITIIAIIVELVGIGVTVWHAMHLLPK